MNYYKLKRGKCIFIRFAGSKCNVYRTNYIDTVIKCDVIVLTCTT